jgi:hypothetical protein
MKKGNKVLVPRTGGGTSEGEVIEIYRKHARVKFLVGDMFRGKSAPQNRHHMCVAMAATQRVDAQNKGV